MRWYNMLLRVPGHFLWYGLSLQAVFFSAWGKGESSSSHFSPRDKGYWLERPAESESGPMGLDFVMKARFEVGV